jgi:hypothetical protein
MAVGADKTGVNVGNIARQGEGWVSFNAVDG